MSEKSPDHDTLQLATLQQWMDRLLSDVVPVSDGTNLNFFTSLTDEDGNNIGIAKSLKSDLRLGYHVSFRTHPDDEGQHESWDYHWGDREPKVIYVKAAWEDRFQSIHTEADHPYSWPMLESDILVNLPELLMRYAAIGADTQGRLFDDE